MENTNVGQEAERSEAKSETKASLGSSAGKERRGSMNSLELANVKNSLGLWAVGTVSSCPVPGPGMVYGKENIGLICES